MSSSAQVIDALFERTVDIVQSLPKTGPIQTSYEEKLALYSLYKQATEGNVTSRRPGMLDMLGRAKWDAWAGRKGLSSMDAKQLYVESMLRTLRKFSDRPMAIALIEELESFSGDVADRVMSASLAQADSDTDSDTRPPSPGGPAQALHDSESERDAVPQLPPSALASASVSRPTSAQATRGRGAAWAGRQSAGPSASQQAPQRRGFGSAAPAPSAQISDSETESDGDTVERYERRQAELESAAAAAAAARGQGGRRGPPGGQSHGPSAAHSRGYATPQSWSRGPGSLSGHGDQRLYAPPGGARMPPSESATGFGGGAGASLYSTAAPSRAPPGLGGAHGPGPGGAPPSEQHYYHHSGSVRPYAPSSVGGRSGGRPMPQQARGAPSGGGDVEQALQSIQNSLTALHERLNRVETDRGRSGLMGIFFGGSAGAAGGASGGRNSRGGALRAAYGAFADALHDIAILVGLSSAVRGNAAPPSYALASGSRAGRTAPGSASGRSIGGSGRSPSGAPLRLAIAVLNLSVRLALDLTSLALLASLVLLLIQRITGRGDPLLLLRIARRWRPRRLLNAPASNRGLQNDAQKASTVQA
ncbi:acbp-domain-containing protein [Ceraceosorus bombacis]|uniref:Acbp-domain-containing protein n=1 Tax=Ceraceosorus bombacis TaxID=401625 RepID=A0A0P1BES5_9BASI|nr:acbp-domain-containing protein [Ceraceosorus bombacis]